MLTISRRQKLHFGAPIVRLLKMRTAFFIYTPTHYTIIEGIFCVLKLYLWRTLYIHSNATKDNSQFFL